MEFLFSMLHGMFVKREEKDGVNELKKCCFLYKISVFHAGARVVSFYPRRHYLKFHGS